MRLRGLYKRYTNRATNGRPYAHITSTYKAPLEGSCRIEIEWWLYKGYTNRATNDRPYAHVISIHKGAVALRQVGGFIRDIQSGRPMVAPTHVTSTYKGAVTSVTEGWLL